MTDQSWEIKGFTLDSAQYHYYPDFHLEPLHMRLELDIDIATETVSGTNTITLQANSEDADFIKLNAVDFDYVNILSSGIVWEYDGEYIDITLENPLHKGQTTDIVVEYKVVSPIAGIYFSYPDGNYPDRPVYAGSDHESERARYWIPAVDHPSVRTTWEYIITSQEHYTILAIGKLLGESVENGQKTSHWKHDFPCPTYISAIAIGELTEYIDESTDAGNGVIPVAYYTSSNYKPEHLKYGFDRTPKMIRWYVEKFKVPFAWAKYYQFSFIRIFGAMENQSLVSWADYAVLDEESFHESGIGIDDVNVHEMAHTYFGDMVVIKNWSHAWLKESWATYCSALYKEDNLSYVNFEAAMYANANSYFAETKNYIRPIVNNKYAVSWEMFDRHLYPGGAWRLHMLRKLLGDQVFFSAVTDYLETFKGKVVETIDFQRKLEEHSGRSLGEFFDQWILHPKGYPILELNFSYNKEKQEGSFTITQNQIKEDVNDVRNRPFVFSLDLAWFVGERLYNQSIEINQKIHEYTVTMEKPEFVTIDPDHKILFKLESKLSDQMYIAMLTKADDLFTRRNAISKLVDSGKRQNIQAVVESYFNQEYWGDRLAILRNLGDANSQFAIEPLIEIAQKENEVKILSSIPNELRKYRDARINAALVEFANRTLPPQARQSAIAALGSPSTEHMELIMEKLGSEDWKYYSRLGAFQALSRTRDSKYLDTLLTAVKAGNQPEVIRRQLIFLLGSYGNWMNKNDKTRIIEVLEDLLRDPFFEIRSSVFSTLVRLGAKGSIKKMRKIYGLHPKQSYPSFEKQLKRLKSSSDEESALSNLVSRVEKIETTIQKLDEKLQKLSE